jgi:hypothetical protein
MAKTKLFDPEADLMGAMCNLTPKNAKQWYKEYLEFHKGVDQGVSYLVGYFMPAKAKMLRKAFGFA